MHLGFVSFWKLYFFMRESAKKKDILIMMERKHIIFSGDVQGVGFRYRANYAAQGLGLTGYVRNLYNGKVEVEVQGEKDLINRFLEQIYSGRYIHIEDIEVEIVPIVEDERSFCVRHDGYWKIS